MVGPESTGIAYAIDSRSIGVSQTKASAQFFRWQKIGESYLSAGMHDLELRALGEVEAITLAAVVPKSELRMITQELQERLSQKDLLILVKLDRGSGTGIHFSPDLDTSGGSSLLLESSGRATYNNIDAPVPGKYVANFRLKSPTGSALNISLDGHNQSVTIPTTESFRWYRTEFDIAGTGEFNLTLIAQNNIMADMLLLTLDQHRIDDRSYDIQMKFRRITPVLYDLQVSSASPFFVLRGTAFSELWHLSNSTGEQFPSLVANAFEGAYPVSSPGHYTLKLQFVAQEQFQLGWRLTIAFYAVWSVAVIWLVLRAGRRFVREGH